MEPWPVRFALWMSRRNGRALVRGLKKRMRSHKITTGTWPRERWNLIFEGRPGWAPVDSGEYRFHDGQLLMLRQFSSVETLVEKLAEMELEAVSRGLSPEMRTIVVREGIAAAMSEWKQIN